MISQDQVNGRHDPDTFDVAASIRDIRDAAKQHKWLVWLTVALTLALVTVYVVVWPPIYRTEATLMVERDADTARDHFYEDWNVFRKDDAKSEMELIAAGPILKEVVKREHLTYDDVYHPFLSHLTYLWQSSWLGRNYKAAKNFLLRKKRDPDEPSQADLELGRTVVDMKAGITLEPVSESNVGRLTVKGPSRRVAAIANTLINVYLERRADRYRDEAHESYETLAQETQQAQEELNAISGRRRDFANQHELTFDFSKETLQVGKLAELELTIAAARSGIAGMEASLKEIESELAAETPTRNTQTVYELNTIRETAKQTRLNVQTALIQAREKYREDSPEITDLKSTLARLDTLIGESSERVEKTSTEAINTVRQELLTKRNALRADLEGAKAALAVSEGTVAKLRGRLDQLPAWQTKMREFDRDVMVAQQKYEHLSLRREQANVSADSSKAMPSLRVVEFATAPDMPWWPKLKILYPSMLVVGYLIGLGVAFLKSYASGMVRRQHVEGGRGSARLYGVVDGATTFGPFKVLAHIPEKKAYSAKAGD